MAQTVITQETIEEQDLPESVSWEDLIDAPTSLSDISTEDAAILEDSYYNSLEALAGLDNLSIQGWSFSGSFTATGQQAISWTSGLLSFTDGTSFSITGGSASSISTSAPIYIYFDKEISETVLQTTTSASTAVGLNKVLIAVAKGNSSTGKYATLQAFGGQGNSTFITASNIAANTITGNEIAANTITTNKLIAGEIVGFTITGSLFRTATTGQRIEIASGVTNKISFYDSSTLYGTLEVTNDGSDGFIKLIAQDGGGLVIDTGIGASSFSSAELSSNGGIFYTNGNASNGYIGLSGKNEGYFQIAGGPGGDVLESDIPFGYTLYPESDGTWDLGTSSYEWGNGYFKYDVRADTVYVTTGFRVNGILQPLIYKGYVSGTTISRTNSSFTASHPSTGNYTVTHNLNSGGYIVLATALRASGTGAYIAKVESLNSNSFNITIFNDSGTAVDGDFMFTLML